VAGEAQPTDLDIYLVHVSFAQIDDEARRKQFETMPTSLQLPAEQVDALIRLGPELLAEEPDFQELMKDLDARIDPIGDHRE
ncbi:MAG: hypothetical protein R3212_04130, partial [Xanthomonadales bacterium]|nr:hypothetical protein [Xanthomonadales bacterium]